MIKNLSTAIVLVMMTFNAVAGNASVYNANLTKTLKKFEYMLSAHEQANSPEFRAQTLKQMKNEISKASEGATKEELKSTFDELVAKIPSEVKRDSYKELLQSSSKAELEKLLANPSFLEDTFKGESSNFTGSQFAETLLYTAGAALILWLIVVAVEEASRYQTYYSSTVYYEKSAYFSVGCFSSDLTYSEEEFIINDALDKCERRAYNPSTCEFAGFSVSETYDEFWDEYECRVQARARALK